MTQLITQPPSSPPRAHLLRMVKQIKREVIGMYASEFCRFSGSKFELVRVVEPLPPHRQRLRPYGGKLGRAMEEAGVAKLGAVQ